jgi:hypothetical protein
LSVVTYIVIHDSLLVVSVDGAVGITNDERNIRAGTNFVSYGV